MEHLGIDFHSFQQIPGNKIIPTRDFFHGFFFWQSLLCSNIYMSVSENTGTPKCMVYNGKPYQNGWFGGTPILGNIHIGLTTSTGSDGSESESFSFNQPGDAIQELHSKKRKATVSRPAGARKVRRGWGRDAEISARVPSLPVGCFEGQSKRGECSVLDGKM